MSGFQVMPRLTADEYIELEQSIRDDGVLVPIIVSEDGQIVDGHHRAEIARVHGLECPRVVKHGTETELRTFAYSLNLHRRHLSREQKRELIGESLRSDPQLSNREHGKRVGAHKNTVDDVRDDLESTGQIAQSDTRTSGDGRERPASQPPRPSPEVAPGLTADDLDELQAPPRGERETVPPADEASAPEQPEQDYGALDKSLSDAMADTAATFQLNWARAVVRARDLRQLDMDRAVEVIEPDELRENVRSWREWVDAMEHKLRPGLHVVGGRR